MTSRRYGDDEVREIFSLATTGDTRDRVLPAETGGLTLDDLQRIGQEAGIEPARVAQAAQKLDARGTTPAPVRRFLGLPVGMTRVVDLPRAPTDREWEQLISQFRTTFESQGQATTSGGLREWSQGDVHISIEPGEHGELLRITAHNNIAIVLNGLGLMTGGMSLLMGAVVTAAGKPEKALAVLGFFGTIALVSLGTNLVRSPRWARLREQQVDAIAEHAVKRLSNP
jgi:hypothetical protein